MKTYIILLTYFVFFIGCTSKESSNIQTACPEIFVSKEHQYFYSKEFDQTQSLEGYTAAIENFSMQCQSTERDAILSNLEIDFVIVPLNQELKNFEIIYFVSILNLNNEILDNQIFKFSGEFALDENSLPLKTLAKDNLQQFVPKENNSYEILIGFMLTKNQYNFLNN
tara:strand:- start:42 stop:545 length:504 start_codon:yes stop_codon:yes gene_type:complete